MFLDFVFIVCLLCCLGCACLAPKFKFYFLITMAAPGYEWQQPQGTTLDRCERVESRRAELRQALEQKSEDAKALKPLIEEWTALTEARSKLESKLIEEENERLRNETVMETHLLLDDIMKNKMDFESGSLQQAYKTLWRETRQYIQMHDLNTKQPVPEAPIAPPAPPPPPPPGMVPDLSLPAAKKIKRQEKKAMASPSFVKDDKPRQVLKSLNTPLRSQDLLKDLKGGQTVLRRTPLPRSPGGTPCRKTRRLSLSDNGDIITMALRRKFAQAHPTSNPDSCNNSPYDSPLARSERCKLATIPASPTA
eukprot:TRINITY_DN11232_c0_g1_i2.p2 TRINITY_DN11232_c0_g1~~TRINITY_DN11232_c0_g1_i2.p2  ORF type:complete len:308 (+),score=50.12 TRINITY_DN11232_c0_g1_i2:1877-2800(+)